MAIKNTEGKIAGFFDNEGSGMLKRQLDNGIPKSAELHISSIAENNTKVAIDVGSGPGSIVLGLLENGVQRVIGVDLSDEMCKIAKERISEKRLDSRSEIIKGSFLEIDQPKDLDAISLHRVLCCHPDRELMLEKSMENMPKTISITIPRSWLVGRILMGFVGLFARLFNTFRPYIHSQKVIDNQLQERGYSKVNEYKTFVWVTSVYHLRTK